MGVLGRRDPGEGIFRYIKPLVRQGVHNPGVPRALLSKFYSDLFLTWILDDCKDKGEDESETGDTVDPDTNFLLLSKRYSDIHTSKSLSHLQQRIEMGKPLSLTEKSDGKLYAKYRVNSSLTKLIQIKTVVSPSETATAGSPTFTLEVAVGEPISTSSRENGTYVPCLAVSVCGDELDSPRTSYHIVRSDWMERQCDGTWKLPGLVDFH